MYQCLTVSEIMQIPFFENLSNADDVTVLYYPEEDMIIINKDIDIYELTELFVERYMKSSFKKRWTLLESLEETSPFSEVAFLLEHIIFVRKENQMRLKSKSNAKFIMNLLGKPNKRYEYVYSKNRNTLNEMHSLYQKNIDDKRSDDYNVFIWGYMLGMLERDKRKKVRQ